MLNGLPRILIVRLSSIGDVVRVLPALHSLRHAFPDAQIDWAVEPKSAAVVEGHPDLDQILVFERSARFLESVGVFRRFCKVIRANRYDMVFDFHGILKSGLITYASRVRERYGFAVPRSREASYLATNRRVALGAKVLSRVEENLRLCEMVAPRIDIPELSCDVPGDIQEAVEGYFHRTFDGGKLVVAMHVAMDRAEKRWPEACFAELSDRLLADGRFDVLLTFGPGQSDQVEPILAKTRREPQLAPEMPSLKHYMWLAHCSDLYFGGDTGPMHIASAMGTPVVAVFGGTDPVRHAPMKEPFTILTGNTSGYNGEIAGISAEQTYDACVDLLTGSVPG